jgi:hypothetical protein
VSASLVTVNEHRWRIYLQCRLQLWVLLPLGGILNANIFQHKAWSDNHNTMFFGQNSLRHLYSDIYIPCIWIHLRQDFKHLLCSKAVNILARINPFVRVHRTVSCAVDVREETAIIIRAVSRTPVIGKNLKHIRGRELWLHTFTTSALNGGGWTTPRPTRFAPGKQSQYPFNRTLNGLQSRSGNVLCLPGFGPRTFHSVASRYTV